MADDDDPNRSGARPPQLVAIRGTGTADVPAFGIADAEHLIGKEIARLLPGARVEIISVRRRGDARIVEEFVVDYRIELTIAINATGNPMRAAFNRATAALRGSRYARTSWDPVTPPGS